MCVSLRIPRKLKQMDTCQKCLQPCNSKFVTLTCNCKMCTECLYKHINENHLECCNCFRRFPITFTPTKVEELTTLTTGIIDTITDTIEHNERKVIFLCMMFLYSLWVFNYLFILLGNKTGQLILLGILNMF